MNEPSCPKARELCFEHRHGELDAAGAHWLDEHLLVCESCRVYRLRLDGLLDSDHPEKDAAGAPSFDRQALFGRIMAEVESSVSDSPARAGEPLFESASREQDSSLEQGLDKEALLSRILADVEGGDRTELTGLAPSMTNASSVQEPAPTRADSRRRSPSPLRRASRWIGAGMAVAAAAGIFLLVRPGDDVIRDGVAERPIEVPLLVSVAHVPEGIRVLESTEARWRFGGDRGGVIFLEAGTLVVEYEPGRKDSLRLVGPSFEVEVVGTVFFASAEGDGEVAVLRGEVDVRREGRTTRLGEGQRVSASGAAIALEPSTRHAIEEILASTMGTSAARTLSPELERETGAAVDIEPTATGADLSLAALPDTGRRPESDAGPAHMPVPRVRRPEDARQREPSPSPKPSPVAPWDLPGESANRWAHAEAALASRDWTLAVVELEFLLAGLPPGHEAEAPLRLDLARLYAVRLGRPEPAAEHLRRFVRSWPEDVAAGAALRRLCALAGEMGRPEPLCED